MGQPYSTGARGAGYIWKFWPAPLLFCSESPMLGAELQGTNDVGQH